MAGMDTTLDRISRFVAGLDLSDPAGAEALLNREFAPDSAEIRGFAEAARLALEEGRICDKGGAGLKFSRVRRPENDPGPCSVDAVLMEDSIGPEHTHTRGEVCFNIPLSGAPTFEGRSDSWMVLGTGSRHRPTVRGGRMLILYWWPGGAVEWHR